MSDQSHIEWTDATWNPVRGCVKVSPGCANCYAETFAERFRGVPGHAYEQGFDLRLVPEKLAEPLYWKKPRRIFVNSMSDLFQDGVPDSYIDWAFAVMALAHWHTFQLLTKRAERMQAYLTAPRIITRILEAAQRTERPRWYIGHDSMGWPIRNVWLGVSVENRAMLPRMTFLRDTPAAVRFVSFEPLLEHLGVVDLEGIHWAIGGGESGPHARDCHVDWLRALQGECQRQSVAWFLKQLGRQPYAGHGAYLNLRNTKGGDMAEWPDDLRVREFPLAPPVTQ